MKQLSTKVFTVDFKKLINNATNRKYWQATWKIFEYDGHVINLTLNRIDIPDNKLLVRISVTHPEKRMDLLVSIAKYNVIPLQEENYNEKALLKNLSSSVDELLQNTEVNNIRKSDEYKIIEQNQYELKMELLYIAEDFLDGEGVSNGTIRQAYIEKYIEENNEDLCSQYITDKKKASNIPCRMTWFNFIGFPDRAKSLQEYIPLSERNISNILKESEEIARQIETNDMQDYIDNLDEL